MPGPLTKRPPIALGMQPAGSHYYWFNGAMHWTKADCFFFADKLGRLVVYGKHELYARAVQLALFGDVETILECHPEARFHSFVKRGLVGDALLAAASARKIDRETLDQCRIDKAHGVWVPRTECVP